MNSLSEEKSSQQNDNQINDNNSDNKEVNKLSLNSPKRGIVYLSFIPKGMNCKQLRQLLSQFGEIDRIYLEKDKSLNNKKKKSYNISYSEGWVEFKKKRVAKLVAKTLNGTQIGGKRKNRYYDSIWSLKYLHKFKWSHLAEHMAYEKALRDQRLRLEIGRAKKEANFYSSMIEKSIHKKVKNDNNSNDNNDKRNYKQRITDEQIRNNKNNNNNNDIDFDLLSKIFK